jgi:hypothetical protein
MQHLAPAIARLRLFRQSWNEGDLIDEESGLTAGDLDEVLAELDGRYTASTHGDEDWDSPASS